MNLIIVLDGNILWIKICGLNLLVMKLLFGGWENINNKCYLQLEKETLRVWEFLYIMLAIWLGSKRKSKIKIGRNVAELAMDLR